MKAIEHYKVNVRIGTGAGAADTIQPLSVPKYEVRILRAIHNTTNDDGDVMQMVVLTGRELVPLPIDEDTGKQIVFSPRAALERLKRVYGGRRNAKIVGRTFKTSKVLARLATIVDVPDGTKAPIKIPKGMKAAVLSKKLMAVRTPAPLLKKAKKPINGSLRKVKKAEHRATQ